MLNKIFSKDSVWEKIILTIFLVISLFLVSLSFVYGQVSIEAIDAPSSIAENSMLAISFEASTNLANSTISYRILQYDTTHNWVLVSNNNTYGLLMNYSSAGAHIFTLTASDESSTTSENITVAVQNMPLTIALSSPGDRTYNTRSILLNVTLSTYADTCTYYLNNSDSGVLSSTGNSNFHKVLTLQDDGSYLLAVNCSNAYDSAQATATFDIDTVNPAIISESYTIDANYAVTLNVATGSQCICKYDISDRPYDLMSNTFTNTNTLQHFTIISGLPDGSYDYYVRCRNIFNNNTVLNAGILSFNIAAKPSASISLSRAPPLKSGTYDVRLLISKSVPNAPILYYNFNDDQSPRYIPLTGSGVDWKGYMVIEEASSDRIGAFHYSAADSNGVTGNSITNGEIFLVDTTKPAAPGSAKATVQNDGAIKLKWYYDGEEVTRYNIYRTTNGNVDYIDYYDSTNSNQYVDNGVIDGIAYYYRIAAIDKADNDGVLSEVVQATSTKNVAVSDNNVVSTVNRLNDALVPKVDQQIMGLNKFLMDIEARKSELNQLDDPSKLKIVNILHLSEKIKSAESKITDLIQEATALKDQDLKTAELDVRLNKLRLDAIKAESGVAEDILISEQSTYTQTTQESDIDQAINSIMTMNLSKKALENYSTANKQLQDDVNVNTEIIIFKIKYMGKDDYDKYTLVKKTVTAPLVADVLIVETIPKEFSRKASDLVLDIDGQQQPSIVNEDPVLSWGVDQLSSKTIYYMSNDLVDMSAAKNGKTVVLYRPTFKNTELKDTGKSPTGMVALESVRLDSLSPIQLIVLLGVGLIIGLSAYYVVLDKKEKKRNVERLKAHRIVNSRAVQPITASNISGQNPRQNITRTQNVTKTTTRSQDISSLLEKANAFINKFDYENARILYNQCMVQSGTAVFTNTAARNDAKMMLNHLYLKLAAYRIIYSSRKQANIKSYIALRKNIIELDHVYATLLNNLNYITEEQKDAERKFIDYIYNSKKHLETITS